MMPYLGAMLLTEDEHPNADPKRKETMSTEGAPGSRPSRTEMEAEFVKSNFYRVVHADGAFGGVAPNGQIRMAIYSEAQRTPQTMTYDISSGKLREIGRYPEVSSGPALFTRELEVDIAMSLPVARVLHRWLGDKISEVERLMGQAKESAQDVNDGNTSNIPTA